MNNKFKLSVAIASALFFTACANNTLPREDKPDVSLTNTYWKAMVFYDTKVQVVRKEAHIKFDTNSRVHGVLGCNNFFGSFKKEDTNISFQHIGSTRMLCQNMKTEDTFSKVLKETKTYQIKGEVLYFFDKKGTTISTFNAVYF